MGTLIHFPGCRIGERLATLRDFLDNAENQNKDVLSRNDIEKLEIAIECAWPGLTFLTPWWKFVFVFAGFAMGFGIHP